MLTARSHRIVRRSQRHAFTLVEIMLVVVILGALSVVATVSLRGHIRKAKIAQAFIAIEQADQFARTTARREKTMLEIKFQKKSGKIEVSPIATSNSKATKRWTLPSGVEVGEFRHVGGVERIDTHRVIVAANGVTASYGLTMSIDKKLGPTLVTLGFSGQQVRVEDQADVAIYFPR